MGTNPGIPLDNRSTAKENTMGFVWYDGPSQLTGDPIIAIATNNTRNKKTGDMWQTWILRSDMPPMEAVKTGADRGICGSCRLRGITDKRKCYVNVWQAPTQIYMAWLRGSYETLTPAQAARRMRGSLVRGGSYGDPAALPRRAWQPIIDAAAGWAAYTHQWREFDWLKPYAMASVDTVETFLAARSLGWRTFRTRTPDQPIQAREFMCPASDEAGKIKTCSTCLACHGADRPNQASVTIQLHGIRNR